MSECQKQGLNRDVKNALPTLGSTLTTIPLCDLLLIWLFSLPCSSLLWCGILGTRLVGVHHLFIVPGTVSGTF